MAKDNQILSEDGQHVEARFPGESLQDQDKRAAYEDGDVPSGTMSEVDAPQDDKDLLEVRRVHRENAERAFLHSRAEVHREITAESKAGEAKARPIEVHVFGGRLHLDSHGEAVLDREGIISLRNACEAAFQAVS